jgi:hypothetical protein
MRKTFSSIRFAYIFSVAISTGLVSQNVHAQTGTTDSKPALAERDGSHDFDFLFGTWKVHNRRLSKSSGSNEVWSEFESTATERPFWDGHANFEEWRGDLPTGHLDGTASRIYNPKTHQWSIYWATPAAGGAIISPMIGHFTNGRGEFFGQDENGVGRFVWTSSSANQCRWEQAVSTDGGKTWKTNWTMDFTRQK